MFIGALFFVFFFPSGKINNKKTIFLIKVLTIALLFLAVIGIFWLKGQPQIIKILEENKLFVSFFQRLWPNISNFSINNIISSRGAGWKVAFQALIERPIFGYGPENFSIGFDRYYDPALPGLLKMFIDTGTGWWDRAHNFLLDLGVTAGAPALLVFIFLFIVLFWKLQKIKNSPEKSLSSSVIYHSIQATFIAYFTANFFSFDDFSTYLILFLIIGYCFYLLFEPDKYKDAQVYNSNKDKPYFQNKFSDYIVLSVLFFIVAWFIWTYNINPMIINRNVNIAEYYKNNIKGKEGCIAALNLIGQASLKHSIADYHLDLQYVDIINSCLSELPEAKKDLLRKEIEILEESLKIRPYYTRAYILLATSSEILAGEDIPEEEKNQLIENSFYYTKKAEQLAPKHQEVYVIWSKAFLLKEQNEEANEKADYCIKLNPDSADCWWAKTVVLANLGDIEETIKSMKIAKEKGVEVDIKNKISQLIKVFGAKAKATGDLRYYKGLVVAYQELINFEPDNFQNHASLAFVYKTLGEYKKAREEALIVLEMSPQSKQAVEEFLRSLPY
jgi:tetratricopeptide (TPR) repeat protein